MDPLIKEWLEARAASELAAEAEESALQVAQEKAKLPRVLRMATPRDIKVGTVIWYPRSSEDGGTFWKMVDEVHRSSDDRTAYVAEDGCFYGLDGALVEVEQ